MATHLNVRAHYSKGTLKLKKPLHLPKGAEVLVTVTPLDAATPRRKARPKLKYPTVALPSNHLRDLVGVVALGGDALADTEALNG
jgi:predicted DNA-binding antitoxin AbrB/MazE fold protein